MSEKQSVRDDEEKLVVSSPEPEPPRPSAKPTPQDLLYQSSSRFLNAATQRPSDEGQALSSTSTLPTSGESQTKHAARSPSHDEPSTSSANAKRPPLPVTKSPRLERLPAKTATATAAAAAHAKKKPSKTNAFLRKFIPSLASKSSKPEQRGLLVSSSSADEEVNVTPPPAAVVAAAAESQQTEDEQPQGADDEVRKAMKRPTECEDDQKTSAAAAAHCSQTPKKRPSLGRVEYQYSFGSVSSLLTESSTAGALIPSSLTRSASICQFPTDPFAERFSTSANSSSVSIFTTDDSAAIPLVSSDSHAVDSRSELSGGRSSHLFSPPIRESYSEDVLSSSIEALHATESSGDRSNTSHICSPLVTDESRAMDSRSELSGGRSSHLFSPPIRESYSEDIPSSSIEALHATESLSGERSNTSHICSPLITDESISERSQSIPKLSKSIPEKSKSISEKSRPISEQSSRLSTSDGRRTGSSLSGPEDPSA